MADYELSPSAGRERLFDAFEDVYAAALLVPREHMHGAVFPIGRLAEILELERPGAQQRIKAGLADLAALKREPG